MKGLRLGVRGVQDRTRGTEARGYPGSRSPSYRNGGALCGQAYLVFLGGGSLPSPISSEHLVGLRCLIHEHFAIEMDIQVAQGPAHTIGWKLEVISEGTDLQASLKSGATSTRGSHHKLPLSSPEK